MLVCLHDGIIIVYNIEWFIMMSLFDFDDYMVFDFIFLIVYHHCPSLIYVWIHMPLIVFISSFIYKIDIIVWYNFICLVLYTFMSHALNGLLKNFESQNDSKIDQFLS